ncbi:MAG TPA: peptidylprolyl isomerase [Bacteroidales bacterium]|nr:peptidylprolyl isomerase [Bacteroidales bacterium]
MKYLKFVITIVFLGSITLYSAHSQSAVIDQVVAIVGNKIIKQSDIESQYLQVRATGDDIEKCHILEVMLRNKLMVNQAAIDSIEVTDSEVENKLNEQLNYQVSQYGQDVLEKHFGKSLLEMKDDMRTEIRDMMISQKMEEEIAGKITITPSEVKAFYNKLNKDSLPLINSKIELYQIGLYPPYSEQAIFQLKEKMLELRKRIIEGESFTSLAVLYSEDGSAMRGGELGFTQKGAWDPEFAKAAFALKERGEVSKIIESQFGYHLIQLIEKRGDMVNVRHILMKPKADPEAVQKVITRLDSITDLIRKDSITFEKAALYFSEDKSTRFNNGLVMNPQTEEPRFEMDQLNPIDYRLVKDLKIGEISQPYESVDDKGKRIYKVSMIKSRSNPHRANLKDDFDLLKNIALNNKRNTIINQWISEKIKTTYIHIDDLYKNCDLTNKEWIK